MKRVLLITSKKKKMERKKEKKNTKPGFLRKKESTCLKKVRKVEDYQSNYLKNVLVSTNDDDSYAESSKRSLSVNWCISRIMGC